MLQAGNQAPGTRPLPGAHRGSAQGPPPRQAVPGALGGCEAATFRRTATELPTRRPDFLNTPGIIRRSAYADDAVVHCATRRQAEVVLAAISARMEQVGLRLHPAKTR
jgi:hypothetical protein